MKIMLLGIILILLGQSFNALGLEWVLIIAGVALGIVGFVQKSSPGQK